MKIDRYHYVHDYVRGKWRATLFKNGGEYDILEDESFEKLMAKIGDSGILDKMRNNIDY